MLVVARIVMGLLVVAAVAWAVAGSWHDVRADLARVSLGGLAGSCALALLALVLTLVGWRAMLADLGSPLPMGPASGVLFVGQLGKYLPGSVWPVVVQTELGRDYGVPRRRTATATVISLLMGVAVALLVVLVALPFAPAAVPHGFGWAVLLVVPLLVLLHPVVLGPLADRALRLIRREPLEHRPSVPGTLLALLWGAVSWAGAGIQVWALAAPLGAGKGPQTVVLLIGGYALAWAVGFIVIVAPAGAGAREVALAAVLSTVLDPGAALVVVLLSRVLFTAADLLTAGIGVAVERRHRG